MKELQVRPLFAAPPAAPADMVIVPREILMRALELLSCIGCSPEGAEHDVRDAAKLQEDIKPFIAAAPAPAVPVAFCELTPNGNISYFDGKPMIMVGPVGNECHTVPLFAGAPSSAAPVVPLTDADIDRIADAVPVDEIDVHITTWHRRFARAVLSAAPAAPVPLTDDQIDEIWDGSFDSADPKRQLSFRQIITRAIEAHHGIGGSNG